MPRSRPYPSSARPTRPDRPPPTGAEGRARDDGRAAAVGRCRSARFPVDLDAVTVGVEAFQRAERHLVVELDDGDAVAFEHPAESADLVGIVESEPEVEK